MQGMIRDFFSIKKNTLFEEINAIKGQTPTDIWEAIDAVRKSRAVFGVAVRTDHGLGPVTGQPELYDFRAGQARPLQGVTACVFSALARVYRVV